jgi:spore germination cell wall hydrolase CwlJ-like protein
VTQGPLPVSFHDLDVTARTLWGEARGEDEMGQRAVAWVIRNRADWPGGPHWWGDTALKVCMKPMQFSCWNAADPNREKMLALKMESQEYRTLHEIARAVMTGEVDDPTGHASHYERIGTGAEWARGRQPSATIGNHAFYSIGPAR